MKQTNYRENISEVELIVLLQEGSEYAFELFYNRYRPQIYHVALQYLKSQELAKEVIQDVFLKIWNDRGMLLNVTSVKAWVYTLSKNLILNRLKRVAIEERARSYLVSNYVDQDFTTIHKLEDQEYYSLLQDAIHSLPEQQRRVFELARNKKLTYDAIAKKLEVSPLTVKTHMARALKHLRSKINQFGIDLPIVVFFLEDFF